ncbi:hydrogenase maturation protease [Mycobacterium sp. ZZG]
MSALVIGVGNPFRRDDGIGPAVAAEVGKLSLRGVRVMVATDDPAEMIDAWDGTELTVVVDAAAGDDAVPGRIRRWTPEAGLRPATVSTHALDLPAAYALGQVLGRAPRRLVVLAVDAAEVAFGDGLSSALTAAVPTVVAAVVSELRGGPPCAGIVSGTAGTRVSPVIK